ncbi:diphthine--ammonia ligase [Methanopyrus kandleri]|uniref:Predicted ATPase of the PP-loop superfamily n=2 Tax=Methanopyrus kandleri TaxID=2320 RepID=Q8TXL8_METKA|nr:diphthine--ammonia ligase [Methanopyrus kandleri]AAM01859.1 Predicted ATPase of the PP-loop superfamily [Methanopyrus kandleri AV19]HII70131.1 diphthine--ammonia ligase [Methanopyrus kandleri]
MRAVALLSGGKDSTLAAHLAVEEGYELTHGLTVVPSDPESMMFHVPNADLGALVAQVMGLEPVRIRSGRDDEADIEEIARVLEGLDVDALVSGAIASRYQKERLDRLCEELGIEHVHPLWGMDPFEELELLVERGFEVMIIGVSAAGMDESWLGRRIDEDFIEDIRRLYEKYRIHPAGEGGEYETLVLDAPLFERRIVLERVEKRWDGFSGELIVEEARLMPKRR